MQSINYKYSSHSYSIGGYWNLPNYILRKFKYTATHIFHSWGFDLSSCNLILFKHVHIVLTLENQLKFVFALFHYNFFESQNYDFYVSPIQILKNIYLKMTVFFILVISLANSVNDIV